MVWQTWEVVLVVCITAILYGFIGFVFGVLFGLDGFGRKLLRRVDKIVDKCTPKWMKRRMEREAREMVLRIRRECGEEVEE